MFTFKIGLSLNSIIPKMHIYIFSFQLSFHSDLYKIANKPSKYTFKKSCKKVGAKSKQAQAALKIKDPQFGSDWEPEDVEKIITEELKEIQETLMVRIMYDPCVLFS